MSRRFACSRWAVCLAALPLALLFLLLLPAAGLIHHIYFDRSGLPDLEPFIRTLGEKEAGGRTALPIFREIMLRVYAERLVGPVPQFPREIEDGIDQYLVRQGALKAERDQPERAVRDDGLIASTPLRP